MEGARIDLSVVIPVYDEASNIGQLLSELRQVLAKMGCSYEIIVVDDGSTDETLARLEEARSTEPHLKVITLTRNFGQTPAIMAGLDLARGEAIVTMDGDLQNDPRDIPRLIEELDRGFDLVSGWRRKRQDAFLHRVLPSLAANRLFSWVFGIPVHDYGCTLKAYRRELIADLRLYGDMHRFIPAFVDTTHDRIAEVEVNHRPRRAGQTKYGTSRTVKVILDLFWMLFLSRYLTNPMRFFGGLGLASGVGGIALGALVIYMKVHHQTDMTGNPLLILAVLFALVAVQLVSLGILGEINVRTYYESQGKKTYKVRQVLGE